MKHLNGGVFQIKLNTHLNSGDNIEIVNEEDKKNLLAIFRSPLTKPVLMEFVNDYDQSYCCCLANLSKNNVRAEINFTFSSIRGFFAVDENEIVYSIFEI